MKKDFFIWTIIIPTIKENILRLVEHPEQIESIGCAGTELMKKYTWDYYAENVKKVYSELLNR